MRIQFEGMLIGHKELTGKKGRKEGKVYSNHCMSESVSVKLFMRNWQSDILHQKYHAGDWLYWEADYGDTQCQQIAKSWKLATLKPLIFNNMCIGKCPVVDNWHHV
jgi:hypothetical protein